ncbi:BC1881 family protein [Bacillus sp. B15-48]|uniref:BC1881 family protein n=1 Tax=Bacillus sp. B15-48 TaxID=1548601 RepID=UPI00193FD1FB|nr:BC1881 family protein [Bacillus sp. B15-48]
MEQYSTVELSNELVEREGISHIKVEPYEKVTLTTGQGEREFTGPVIIIINQD